jgi:hypothetical protein
MFANVGPSDNNTSETISTLRFAERAKQIQNKPVKNLDPKDAKIQDLLDKIAELEKRVGGNGLEAEEKLREKIEQLEVEIDELRQSQSKDTLELEETNKKQLAQINELGDAVAAKESALASSEQARKVMESNFQQDLGLLRDLCGVTTNFIKRACSAEQLKLIRSKLPPDNLTDGDVWEVREIELTLDGFIDVYEEWRRNVFTVEDMQREVQRGKKDVEDHLSHRLGELERERADLMHLREEEAKDRNANVEQHSAVKVELANLKEENAKLREKIERDQERMKKKLDKMREDAKGVVDEADTMKADLAAKDREIEKLKKMPEDCRRGPAGPTGTAGYDRLMAELEETRLAKQAVETRMRQMILQLRRDAVVDGNNNGNGPPPPPGAEGDMGITDDTFFFAAAEGADIDGDLVSQMQQQLRIQHRLHQLRHAQQRKLEDIVRKHELLKTGKVTPLLAVGGGAVSDKQLQEAVAGKEKVLQDAIADHEKVVDKLVEKMDKKASEWAEKEKALTEEKAALEEERAELNAHVEDLSKFNSQLAIEVENMRSQSKATKTESDIETERLSRELEHVRSEVQQLQALVDGSRRATQDLDDVKVEYQRLQAQNVRTEASLKDKMAALDSSRQMIKWTSSLLEAEKKKVAEAEQSVVAAEKQYREMEESWRQQMMDNSNKLVQMNNRRLEEQASQYQSLIADEQEKQKAMRERVKKAKQAAAHSAQRYDEMVLENEVLLMQLEELKVSTIRTYRDQQRAAAEEQSGSISAMIRGRPQNAHRQL